MKNVITTLLSVITILFLSNINTCYSNNDSTGVTFSDLGTEFWIAIPHVNRSSDENLRAGYTLPIQLWVSSKVSTKVTIESADGSSIPKKVYSLNPNAQLTIDLTAQLMLDDNDNEVASTKGIHITSDDPVSVNVFMAYESSGEAYHAIPVGWLGTDYYTLNLYQDSLLRDGGDYLTAPGQIVVVATQDNTSVTYKPKLAETQKGVKAGASKTITLGKGQTLLIQSKNKTGFSQQSLTDLTGTYISATAPVVVISGHTKSSYPRFVVETADSVPQRTDGVRNALVEMLLPVKYLGTEYVSIPLKYADRTSFPTSDYRGDLLRFVATANNTIINQKRSDGTLMQIGTKLSAGQSYDMLISDQPAYYTSTQPFLVGQYGKSYDSQDPPTMLLNGNGMLLNLLPISRWTGYASFRVASNLNSYIYLVFDAKYISNLKFDDVAFNLKFSGLQKVPGTNYFYVISAISDGPHTIVGDSSARFSGYCYGNSMDALKSFSYGYPIGINFFNSCNDSVYVNETLINDKITGKINAIDYVEKDSCASLHEVTLKKYYNYTYTLNKFTPGVTFCDFVLQLDNIYDTAYAVISIVTNSGKVFTYSYSHTAVTNNPLSPVLLTPENGKENLTIPVKYQWSKSKFDTTFTLQVARDSDFVNIVSDEPNLLDTVHSKGGYSIDSTYYWRVRASNSFGYSPWSEVRKFRIYNLNLSLVSPADSSINMPLTNVSLNWTKPQYTTSFNLQLAENTDFAPKILDKTNLTDTILPVTLTKYNQTYYWKVQAKSADGTGSWSNVWNFVTEPENAVTDPNLFGNQDITIIPNPVTETATIKFNISQAANVTLKLTDMLGNQIFLINNKFMDSGAQSFEWDAGNYPAGMYFYMLEIGNGFKTGKIPVIR
jgi:hypothetical protein